MHLLRLQTALSLAQHLAFCLQASKRRLLLADIDVSLQQAATFSQSAEAQQQAIDQLQRRVTVLQRQVEALTSCLLPGDAVWRPNPPPLEQAAVPVQHKAAVLVPYRDREQQLSDFLPRVHDLRQLFHVALFSRLLNLVGLVAV